MSWGAASFARRCGYRWFLFVRDDNSNPGNYLPTPTAAPPDINHVTVFLKRLLLVATAFATPVIFGSYRGNIAIDMRNDVGVMVFRDVVTLEKVFEP
jgi:hypothetical protein